MQYGLQELEIVSESPILDAQVLLADVMRKSRTWLLSHPDTQLDPDQMETYLAAIRRCSRGMPLPYILGWWEFYGRRFQVTEAVLIPRPETEHLVEAALDYLKDHTADSRVVDVGTGSGCIAVSLALEQPDLHVIATDISLDALKVAWQNAVLFEVAGRIHLVQADLIAPLTPPFDLVCANLPYIPTSTLELLEVGKKEPFEALDGGDDGLVILRRLLEDLPGKLSPTGRILLEIESTIGDEVLKLATMRFPNLTCRILKDLSGLDRILVVDADVADEN